MSRRKPKKTEIIEYKELKMAAGGGGGGSGGGGFRPGDSLVCKVINEEPGGYAVLVLMYNLTGFLPTDLLLKPGQEILCQFVCVHNHRVLLSTRLSGGARNLSTTQSIVWEEHLQAEGGNQEDAEISALVKEETYLLKRATDLILPPIDTDSIKEIRMENYDIEWLITDLVGGLKTGCVKASCERTRSRSAMLLYRGRVVGCIFGARWLSDILPTEQSLQRMLADLEVPETIVKVYDLPESIVLAMSTLFLGYPVQREHEINATDFVDLMSARFKSKSETACLIITVTSEAPSNTILCCFYQGEFCGTVFVDDQQFKTDKELVYDLLRNEPDAQVEASVLPTEMPAKGVRFGFSLSLVRKQMQS